jgi:ParB/RepB/Spo0J family partition protein
MLDTTREGAADESAARMLHLPIAAIEPDPDNVRRQQASDEANAGLAASVAQIGVVVPVLARPHGRGFRLVHGERRYRAALAAGHLTIPAMVRDMTDAEAAAAQAAENLARARMSDLDQWRAVVALQDRHGWDVPTAARALGLGEALVRRMDRVGRCVPAVLKAMEQHGPPSPDYLRKIANAPKEVQAEAVKRHGKAKPFDWYNVAQACVLRRVSATVALFDWKAPDCRVRFEQDLFAEPGSPEEWTSTDLDGFLAAQVAYVGAQTAALAAQGERIQFVPWDRAENRPLIPQGYERDGYRDDEKPIPKGSKRLRLVSVAEDGYQLGKRVTMLVAPIPPKPAAAAKGKGGGGDPPAEPRVRPPVAQRGMAEIAAAKTDALRRTLREASLPPVDAIRLLLLALGGANVSVTADPDSRHRTADLRQIADQAAVAEGIGNLCRLAGEALARMALVNGPTVYHGQGEAAERIGDAVSAHRLLPRFDTAEFLAHVSGAELRRLAATARIGSVTKVADIRAALVGKLPDWRPDAAMFRAEPPEPEGEDDSTPAD